MRIGVNILIIIIFTSIPIFAQQKVEVVSSKNTIEMSVLHDKIAAAWIGQMIGNMYGLPHENKYVTAPGLEKWPYGYSKSLDKLKKYEGAFSDDDTDVEYMYLLQMEKFGSEPTYSQLRDAWMNHIRDRVWLANRAALGLMHFGFTPPFTGQKNLNPHWYQIDPQLINEIWAVTAPGMVNYAAVKSEWAARITSDDWGVEPTIFYGAMYSAAFFESDFNKLIEIGLKALPENGRFTNTVKEMIALHKKHPTKWQDSWNEMAQKYYVNEPEMTKTIWNANLNGACAVLAMLYGEGNFQRTLDLSCAMGFDADNQAATVGGLMGVIYGMKGLPENLYLPIEGWKLPFNDKYINITRYDLPDSKISDIINKTLTASIDLIKLKGGSVYGRKGKEVVTINTKATFDAPLEFYIGPKPILEVGKEIDFAFYTLTNQQYKWSLQSGELPEGIRFENGKIVGKPTISGYYNITLGISDENQNLTKSFDLVVRNKNIASSADTIYANVRQLNSAVLDSCWYTFGKPIYAANVNVINDGITHGEGQVFYSLAAKANIPKVDYYGYGWKQAKKISMIAFQSACLEEFGGWFTSLNVQYINDKGKWVSVSNLKISPELPESEDVFIQPQNAEYILSFESVSTIGIRIIGDAAVAKHWNKYTKKVSGFTSISELSVYE